MRERLLDAGPLRDAIGPSPWTAARFSRKQGSLSQSGCRGASAPRLVERRATRRKKALRSIERTQPSQVEPPRRQRNEAGAVDERAR